MKWLGRRPTWNASACLLWLAVGCGGPGIITGKVTFDGKPLPGGLVTVFDADNNAQSGQIGTDGTYIVGNIHPGPVKVTVRTVRATGSFAHPDGRKNPYGPFVQIPGKYADPDKADLKLNVKPGRQEFAIDLDADFEKGELQTAPEKK